MGVKNGLVTLEGSLTFSDKVGYILMLFTKHTLWYEFKEFKYLNPYRNLQKDISSSFIDNVKTQKQLGPLQKMKENLLLKQISEYLTFNELLSIHEKI